MAPQFRRRKRDILQHCTHAPAASAHNEPRFKELWTIIAGRDTSNNIALIVMGEFCITQPYLKGSRSPKGKTTPGNLVTSPKARLSAVSIKSTRIGENFTYI